MSRSLLHTFTSRRLIFAVIAIVATALVAVALTVDPRSEQLESGGTDEVRASLAEQLADGTGPATVSSAKAPEALSEVAPGVDAGANASRDAVGSAAESAVDAVSAPIAGGGGATLAPPSLDARIVRSGSIELRVKRRGFEDAWGDAQAVAAAHGGYIVAASRSGAGDGPRTGTITMRVPTGRFDAAVERIREVDGAEVRRLDITSQDVTQEFVDVRSRLRHDRAVEARLLALLAETEGVGEVLAVQGRLDQVQEQIEMSKGRLDYLDKMTTMSTVEVSITAPAASGTRSERDEDSVLGEAFVDARDRFLENVGGAVVWVGGALPALLVLSLLVLVGRGAWRRNARRSERSTPADGAA
jgi:hypothetical protein